MTISTIFEAYAFSAFASLKHVFFEVTTDEEGDYKIAFMECAKCGGQFTYDSDTKAVIGGSDYSEIGNFVNGRCSS